MVYININLYKIQKKVSKISKEVNYLWKCIENKLIKRF